jgi:hypothetical protein
VDRGKSEINRVGDRPANARLAPNLHGEAVNPKLIVVVIP